MLHDGRLIYASTKNDGDTGSISDLLSLAKWRYHGRRTFRKSEEHTAAILAASDIVFSILILFFYLLAGLTAGLTLKLEVCGLPWFLFWHWQQEAYCLPLFLLIRLFPQEEKDRMKDHLHFLPCVTALRIYNLKRRLEIMMKNKKLTGRAVSYPGLILCSCSSGSSGLQDKADIIFRFYHSKAGDAKMLNDHYL